MTDISSLIFPSASTSLSTALSEFKRSNLSISNRLRSIASDAAFVQRIADASNLPLVANERCGSWYIVAASKAGSAYFKSTDGHHGQWAFSLRRLNLQVLDVIKQDNRGGCIIVDSTRKGKSMPDALSKTVPIWICVLNRLLFPDNAEASILHTPEDVVSRSEHAQIEQRIPLFVNDARSLGLDLDGLRARLGNRPMLPAWITPDSEIPIKGAAASGCNTILLCTASSQLSPSGLLDTAYVQGAADDSESWALGLDAAMFWKNSERLLAASDDELPPLIASIGAERAAAQDIRGAVLIKPTRLIWIGNNTTAAQLWGDYDIVVSCSEKPNDHIATASKDRYVHLSCTTGKVGSRQLRSQLVKLARLDTIIGPGSRVLVTCHTGKDLSVGVSLALLCRTCNDHGQLKADAAEGPLTKVVIKHRLSWIMVSMPDAAPSRATLQSVNAFLLG